ncbi:hypothetical protein [Desulfobulbus alkaliphilus]|uniref:hypothetical protein n=1 Tax=Desulfobulbus alkaliphilus TaxID=869814 RepID=UPI00196581CB|nr:hypothetical protein [Desulfobulbus alkaliphilus]MBM9535804.1 hypothetical protein [Desulfobulbus alkaliphilus]
MDMKDGHLGGIPVELLREDDEAEPGKGIQIADRHSIMEKGEIVWSGTTKDLGSNKQLQSRCVGI